MLSNQKPSRFYSVKGLAFTAIALALLMSVTAFASGNSRIAFIDSATEFFGLQSYNAPVAAAVTTNTEPSLTMAVPCAGPGESRSVTLPVIVATPGVVAVPITVGDLTNCGVISYDFNIDYDDSVILPAGGLACTGNACFTQAGTLSASMSVTANATNADHFIISGFQGTPLCASPCAGGETLLILNFNVIGAGGTSSVLDWADYTDPAPAFHPAFVFNEGDPLADPQVDGSISVPLGPTATSTNTDTPTPTATSTFTPSSTSTNTNTPTPTFTPSNTSTPTPTPLCAQIDIEDEVTTSGSSVTLSVSTSDTTTLSPQAISADFRISYDNTILSGVPTSPYGVALGPVGLSNSSSLTVNRQISGSTTTLLISLYTGDTLPFNGSGDLVTITFPTVTGAAGTFTPVNFVGFASPPVPSGFQYNEGFPTSCLANGSVQILGTVAGRVLYDNTMFVAPFTRPVPGVTMNVTGGGFPAVASSNTDANGDYSLSGFGTGIYNVTPFRSSLSLPDTHGSSISAYDAAITAQRVVELITFTPKQNFVANVTQTGAVSSNDAAKMAQWAVGLFGPLPNFTGEWRFTPAVRSYNTPGSFTAEDYTANLLGDPSGNWCDPTSTGMGGSCTLAGTVIGSPRAGGPTRATAVEIPRMEAQTGGDIVIPVSVEGAVDKGIISYQFDLRYDPTVIQPTANAVTLGGTVSSEMSVVFNPAAPGLLRIAVYGPFALGASGTMLNLHFTAVGGVLDVSPLTMENFIFNDGGIRVNIVDGQIKLMPAVANTTQD